MSAIQKFFLAVFPASWARSMEAESRARIAKCPSCGHERTVWDLGGVRWEAAGAPKRRLTCPQCGQPGWHTVTCRIPE